MAQEEQQIHSALDDNTTNNLHPKSVARQQLELCEALEGHLNIQSNGEPNEGDLVDSSLLVRNTSMENEIEQVFSSDKLETCADNDCVDIIGSVDPLGVEKSLIDPMEDSSSTSDLTEDVITHKDEEIDYFSSEHDNDEEISVVISSPMTIDEILVKICNTEVVRQCFVCKRERIAKYEFTSRKDDEFKEYVCEDKCYSLMKENCTNIQEDDACISKNLNISLQNERKTLATRRKCAQCGRMIQTSRGYYTWEGLDFCKEHCLYHYQLRIAKECVQCEKSIEYHQMGKYLVRIGQYLAQFCCNDCLRIFKQDVSVCSYCQSAIPVSNEDYCNAICRAQQQKTEKVPFNPSACFMCDKQESLNIEFTHSTHNYYFCGVECFTSFKFINNLRSFVSKCNNCGKYMLNSQLEYDTKCGGGEEEEKSMQYVCIAKCKLVRLNQRRAVMSCIWCRAQKFNNDLIMCTGYFQRPVYVCSLLCLNLLRSSIRVIACESSKCAQCLDKDVTCEVSSLDGQLKGFCSMKCISAYHSRGGDKNNIEIPVVSAKSQTDDTDTRDIYLFEEDEPPEVANKMTSVRCITEEKQSQRMFATCANEAQTDFESITKMRTVPVPFYIPQPLNTWHCPLPRAVPFPLPIPIPLLVPLLRDSSTEYLKTLKVEPVKPPSDPFEAELLMMAELVAAEKTKDDEETENFSPEGDSFNDDMLQMALKMATDYPEPAVDLEGALTANTITPGHHQTMELTSADDIIHTEPLTGSSRGGPGRGRGRGRGRGVPRGANSRRGRGRPPAMQPISIPESIPPPPPPPPEPIEKPDANMCLKFTFGVNAWKQWVTTKNSELERSSRKLKLFKTDLLQMTADELNYSMCLFVNEVRKPNGTEYAPDTIYYLCLGIQQYLYENGRIDNIFCDTFYERFTDFLDDVCSKFSSLYNDSHYIVTRVEEEHLWESKQLGAHSPFVLLTTLMFFNTKHFNLTLVEEHMQLSFSHIMKHWKRNPHSGANRQTPAGGRNVLLRFYPPQHPQEANARKRKVYEQQENEDNPLRCPVKLYEFYLSKCPESVKTRNDVFYLLPERSCVPESPVWYSTQALEVKALKKMLHRVKMVKEINVALLTH